MLKDRDIKEIRQWVKSFYRLSENDIIVYSGSIVQGWSHKESDVDLYLILEQEQDTSTWPVRFEEDYHELSKSTVPVAVSWVDDVKIDCEIWTRKQIQEMRELLSSDQSKVNWQLTIDEAYFDTFYRLSIARVLEEGSPRFGIFSGSVVQEVASAMARRRMDEVDAYVEDSVGLLASGEDLQAAFIAHIAFGKAIDAKVSMQGEFQPNTKWRPRRVMKTMPNYFKEYWRIETFTGLEPDHAQWTRDVIKKTKSIQMEVEF